MAPTLTVPVQQTLRVARADSAPLTWWSLTLAQGVVAAPPTIRSTARGEIAELDLRSRAFVSAETTEPGPPIGITIVANPELIEGVEEGDELLVFGTTRRRFFRAGGTTVARTEVEAVSIVKVSDRRRRSRLISHALAWIEGMGAASAGGRAAKG